MNSEYNQRDISIVKFDESKLLVIACDSAGGVGPKKGDQLKVPGEIVGKFTVRVPLMEVMAVGADVISVINTLSVELNPTGKKIIKGITKELKNIGLNSDKLINGSTEENMKTISTGAGVTVIGIVDKHKLKIASTKKSDILVTVGYPFVGEEVLNNESKVANLKDLETLLAIDHVHEILPVGSKGIKYEAKLMAKMSKLNCKFVDENTIDFDKSAGPATVLLLSVSTGYFPVLKEKITKPVAIIAKLA